MSNKDLIRQQFGAAANAYATSTVHAQGASLARLLELVQPQPDWHALDVATGAGHTALALAPLVAQVVGIDLTPQMVSRARALAAERSLSNVTFEVGDAEKLPVRPASFDLVTCRVALHHFADPARAVADMARVCKPDGLVVVIDNIVPADANVARAVNSFEKMRDPSHARALALPELIETLHSAGLTVTHNETLRKPIDFHDWLDRMQVAQGMRDYLEAWLLDAQRSVYAFFEPVRVDERITFMLTEGIVIGKK
jgi:ubiquinone/menaquinone biosynthesis C-methylase UbiE